MTNTPTPPDEWEKELDGITRLVELENDDCMPLYSDGDQRVGFKKQELISFISRLLSQAVQAERERYRETNIKSLVEEMKERAEEYGQYHDDDCPLMRENGADFGDVCECDFITTLKEFAHEWMAKVNQRWCAYAEAHRPYCRPEGNKMLTRAMGKKNRNSPRPQRPIRY